MVVVVVVFVFNPVYNPLLKIYINIEEEEEEEK